jgi:hypothetical protein
MANNLFETEDQVTAVSDAAGFSRTRSTTLATASNKAAPTPCCRRSYHRAAARSSRRACGRKTARFTDVAAPRPGVPSPRPSPRRHRRARLPPCGGRARPATQRSRPDPPAPPRFAEAPLQREPPNNRSHLAARISRHAGTRRGRAAPTIIATQVGTRLRHSEPTIRPNRYKPRPARCGSTPSRTRQRSPSPGNTRSSPPSLSSAAPRSPGTPDHPSTPPCA